MILNLNNIFLVLFLGLTISSFSQSLRQDSSERNLITDILPENTYFVYLEKYHIKDSFPSLRNSPVLEYYLTENTRIHNNIDLLLSNNDGPYLFSILKENGPIILVGKKIDDAGQFRKNLSSNLGQALLFKTETRNSYFFINDSIPIIWNKNYAYFILELTNTKKEPFSEIERLQIILDLIGTKESNEYQEDLSSLSSLHNWVSNVKQSGVWTKGIGIDQNILSQEQYKDIFKWIETILPIPQLITTSITYQPNQILLKSQTVYESSSMTTFSGNQIPYSFYKGIEMQKPLFLMLGNNSSTQFFKNLEDQIAQALDLKINGGAYILTFLKGFVNENKIKNFWTGTYLLQINTEVGELFPQIHLKFSHKNKKSWQELFKFGELSGWLERKGNTYHILKWVHIHLRRDYVHISTEKTNKRKSSHTTNSKKVFEEINQFSSYFSLDIEQLEKYAKENPFLQEMILPLTKGLPVREIQNIVKPNYSEDLQETETKLIFGPDHSNSGPFLLEEWLESFLLGKQKKT